MRFEPRPVHAIELVNYDILVALGAEYDKYHGAQAYVKQLIYERHDRPHMTDVVIAAANILEPRLSDGSLIDTQKKRSKAAVAGGAIAASIVDRAGGGDILDGIKLATPTDIHLESVRYQSSQELEEVGLAAYHNHGNGIYAGLLQMWEGELAEPVAQGHVRIGFGIVMHLAKAEIAAQRDLQLMIHEAAQLSDPNYYNFDQDFSQHFNTPAPEAE